MKSIYSFLTPFLVSPRRKMSPTIVCRDVGANQGTNNKSTREEPLSREGYMKIETVKLSELSGTYIVGNYHKSSHKTRLSRYSSKGGIYTDLLLTNVIESCALVFTGHV